jgi:hypothetical protein
MENFKNKILEYYKVDKELKESSESFVNKLLNTPDFHYIFCRVDEYGDICEKRDGTRCMNEDQINELKDFIKSVFKLKFDENGVIFYDEYYHYEGAKLNFKESLDEQIRKAKFYLLMESDRIKNTRRQEIEKEIYRLKSRLGYLENYLKTL